MRRTLTGCMRYELNALTHKKEEMEAGLPTPCSLVCLVKSVWVMRIQLTSSSSGRLFLSADLDLYSLMIQPLLGCP